MDHLAKAKRFARSADGVDITVEWAQVSATLAVAHALIAIVERLPPPAEPPSARVMRLRRKEKEDENGL